MEATRVAFRGLCRLAALALLGMATLAPQSASAAPPWLRAFSPPHGKNDLAVAHYRSEDGTGFIVDRSTGQPLLRFDDSPEIWALSAARGPRGDMIYLTDLGRPLLRTTRMGGVTVFTNERPGGAAATAIGPSSPIRLLSVGPAGLYHILVQASARATHAAHHLIGFEAPDADPASSGLIADAALVASQAVVELAGAPESRTLLTRIERVEILRATAPGASLRGGTMAVLVAPKMGVSGRPSSQRILFAMGAR